MKFALEHQNPFVTGALIGDDKGPFPADTFSLITVGNPAVLLWAVKPAEEGIARGVVARLWNVADAPAAADLTFASGLSSANRTTHIETDIESVSLTAAGALTAEFACQQLQTYRLFPK